MASSVPEMALMAKIAIIAPIAGCISGNVIALSSLKQMMTISKERRLGSYDPFPLSFGFLNALVQLFFAFVIKDGFIFAGNFPGFVLTFWYLMVAMSARDLDKLLKMRMHIVLLLGLSVIFVAYFVHTVVLAPGGMVLSLEDAAYGQKIGEQMFGYMGMGLLSLFYVSPLLTIAKVIRERNSAYFFLPLAVACLINGLLWSLYGFTQGMVMVYAPNLFGALVALVQIVCCILLPKKVLDKKENDLIAQHSNGGRRRSLLPEHRDDEHLVADNASILSTDTKGDDVASLKK